MPYSSESGKSYIKDIVSRLTHASILDIGCGSGTYGTMFPTAHKTGVEVWPAYIEKYGLNDIYDNIHVDDIRSWTPPAYYDVAFAGDVLEHMTREEAVAVFNKLQSCADTVVISIPLGYYPQGEYEGNPYEAHVVDNWQDADVRSYFGEPNYYKIDNEIGVYIYTKQRAKLKICVYAISKNEAHFIKRFCESAADADMILIADTGSTDGLPEEAAKYGAHVHHISISPWRFDTARNAALALVPRDMDICISLDIDEVLQPGWREEIERVWQVGITTRLRYMFDWGCGIQFYYEKIHAKHGYMWHHPCHEYPIPDGRITENWAQTDMLLAVHMPDPTKSRGQYMDLLELSVKEDPYCPRNAFYYARELSFHARWHDAIAACESYLKMPNATWMNERCYAYRVMGRCYNELGDWENAEKAFQMAASEAPNTREPWCELALLCYRQSRWEECFAYAMRTLRITDRAAVYTCDPAVWGYQAHDLAAIAAWNLGIKDVAIKQGQIASDMEPNDERLKANLRFFRGDKKAPNVVHFIYFGGDGARPYSYINYLAVRVAHDVQKPDDIVMWCNKQPIGNPYWEAIRPYVTIKEVVAPTTLCGMELKYQHYQSDVFRLRTLYEHGGIYLDNDMVLTQPLTPLLDFVPVMGAEHPGELQSMSNAAIISPPKAKFIEIWLDRMADRISEKWADHSVVLAAELANEFPDLIGVKNYEAFVPFHWDNKSLFVEGGDIPQLRDNYGIHLWETFWKDDLSIIDDQYLATSSSPFARMFGRYATQTAAAA
jgi:glycosyltransferase involved in cell wall biosynthesis